MLLVLFPVLPSILSSGKQSMRDFCVYWVVFDSVKQLIHLQLNFEILKCLDNTPAIFQLKHTVLWIINQSIEHCSRSHQHCGNMASRNPPSFTSYLENHCTEFNRVCSSVSRELPTTGQSTKECFVWNKGVWFKKVSIAMYCAAVMQKKRIKFVIHGNN